MSRRVTDTALAILYLVCALTAQSSRFGIIRGKALDERGRPISGAKVNAEPEDSRPKASAIQFAETDANGRFLLQHLEWGTYKVFGQKESDGYPNLNFAFYSDNRFPRVTLGPKLPIAEITLHLGPRAARLVGKLRDSSDNSAVHGATITLCRIDHAGYCISTAPSLDDSKFDLLIPTSPISVRFSAAGYEPLSVPLRDLPSGQIRNSDFHMRRMNGKPKTSD